MAFPSLLSMDPNRPMLPSLISIAPPRPPLMLAGGPSLTAPGAMVPGDPTLQALLAGQSGQAPVAPMIPMLQPGASPAGDVVGRFPDANLPAPDESQLVASPPGMGSGAEPSTSGYREFASSAQAPAPEGGGNALGGLLGGGGLRNALMALGLGLQGMGGPYGQNPLLQKIALQRMEQQRQAQGMTQAIQALGGAQTDGTSRAQYLQNLRGLVQDPRFAGNPEAAKLLFNAYSSANTELLKRRDVAEQSLAASKLRALLRQTGDYNAVLSGYPELVAQAGGPEITKQLWDEAKPQRTVVGKAYLATPSVGPGAGTPSVLYREPEEFNLGPDETRFRANAEGVVAPIAAGQGKEPVSDAVGREVVRLGLSVTDLRRRLNDPATSEAARGVLEEAIQRAKVAEATPKPSWEAWAEYKQANPAATYRQFEERFALTNAPPGDATEAGNYLAGRESRVIRQNAAIGSQAPRIKAEAEAALRIGEEHAGKYVTADGRFVQPRSPQRDVDAMVARGDAAFVPFQFDRELIMRTKPLLGEITRIEEIVRRRADLFPPSEGVAPDLIRTTLARGRAAFTSGVDPDVAAIKRGTAPYGASLNRYSGDSGNTALPERVANLQALGSEPATREVALTLLGDLRRLMQDNLSNYGLDPARFGFEPARGGSPTPTGLTLPSGKAFR